MKTTSSDAIEQRGKTKSLNFLAASAGRVASTGAPGVRWVKQTIKPENESKYMKTENTNKSKAESSVRRKAARRGYILTKLRESSRAFHEHGPYMVANDRNCVVYSGVTLTQADEWLSNEPLRS